MKNKNLILSMFYLIFFQINSLKTEHFLSFVMPCYNCAVTIRESLDSFYQQNLSIPFEVVCTDDGSTDNTLSILREYEKKYDNFKVVVHPRNLGGGAANNTCVANSKGDLLFRLDSDNILIPNSMQALIDILDETNCDGAAFGEVRNFTGDKVVRNQVYYNCPNNIADLWHVVTTHSDPAHDGNYLYTRKSFDRAGGYPNEKSGTDTHCFGLKQYMTGSKIAILPDTYYWHLYNPKGYFCREEATGNNRRILWATLKNFQEIFDNNSKNYLNTVNVNSKDVWEAFREKNLNLISRKALESLFQAYKLEQDGKLTEALIFYEDAIKNGCFSNKILEKVNNLKSKP